MNYPFNPFRTEVPISLSTPKVWYPFHARKYNIYSFWDRRFSIPFKTEGPTCLSGLNDTRVVIRTGPTIPKSLPPGPKVQCPKTTDHTLQDQWNSIIYTPLLVYTPCFATLLVRMGGIWFIPPCFATLPKQG